MLKYLRYILAAGFLISLASCHKSEITLLTHQVVSNTTYDLNGIYFVNDSVGHVCGGSRYAAGIVIKTTDGGRTWSAPDSIVPKALYTMRFFSAQEGLLGGFDAFLAYTNDSAKTFSSTQLSTSLPLEHLSFLDRQHGVAVCGLAYRDGAVFNTTNGGGTWAMSYRDTMHSLIGSAYVDDSTTVVCGYGTVIRSHDGGVTYSVVRENGDFYQDVKFVNSMGYAVGYQGEIIRSTDKGQHWDIVKSGNGMFSSPDHYWAVDFIDENNGYAVGESGLMMRTANAGQDWQRVKPFTSERLRAVHMFTATSGIVVGSGGRIYLFQQ